MRSFLLRLGWFLSITTRVSWAWSFSDPNLHSRRSVLSQWITTTTATVVGASTFAIPSPVVAAETEAPEDQDWYYFGAGCFWHMQYEFIQAERTILGRTDPSQYTSLAGYAGGTRTDANGRVCYHNLLGVADYGKLGHGEVVGMNLPSSSNTDAVVEFAKFYFTLFNPKTKGKRICHSNMNDDLLYSFCLFCCGIPISHCNFLVVACVSLSRSRRSHGPRR
jgi:hypothetical protein